MRMPTGNVNDRVLHDSAKLRSPSAPCGTVEPMGISSRHSVARCPVWVTAGLALAALVACDWDMNRRSEGPPRIDPQTGQVPTTTTLPLATGPAASDNARPSTDQNMGRDFQGAIEWSLHDASGARRNVRYLARGNHARLQMDGIQAKGAFDALIWDEKLSVIDSEHQTFSTVSLDDVKTDKAKHDADPDQVRLNKNGERKDLDGVICERYEMDDGPVHVSACVTGLSGTFDVDKLEAISGLDVPAWAEKLLDEELMPLQATARDASGKELYAIDLVRYEAGPVDDALVSLPRTYRAVDSPALP
jgi:uncharacterized protein DUF4412